MYFFLFLFRFLYAISPPTPNIFFIIFGDFTLFPFIFISSLLLIASIGETFDALLADDRHEKYIVIAAKITANIIDNAGS